MSKHRLATMLLLAGLVFCPWRTTQATTILSENFQSGSYAGWTLSGTGYDMANLYLGNWSMRLDGLREGSIAASTQGYHNVSLSMQAAALYLVYGDYCFAEYSTNGGTSWNTLLSVGANAADGAMRSGTISSGLDDNPNLRLRFRAYTLYYHYCYGDNVLLTGTPIDDDGDDDGDNGGGDGGDTGTTYDPLDGNGNVSRSALGYSFLTGSGAVALMDYAHYAVPAQAANPVNTFEGRLTLSGQANGQVQEVGSDNNLPYYAQANQLPAFAFDYVQDGTHIIPVKRGKIIGTHPSWVYVLEPGRVWNENGDNGYSRVALPFSLQERNQDCMWNGVMTFLFKNDGSVSDLAYQIAGGTCAYMQLNFHGRLQASYTPAAVSGAATIKADFETHRAGRMPTRPLSALATDYPGSGVSVANIGSDVTASAMTIQGVAYNGVHYVGGCQTRMGTYPYCDVLDVPSYSSAKSVNGAYGLMRLQQLYPGAATQTIGNWVIECGGSQWTTPTLQNTLDMATGNYDSAGFETDEASSAMYSGFFLPDSESQKAGFACSYKRKATPGTQWVYHSTDSYLLGRAMNTYYQFKTGNSSADFFNDVLVNSVYAPLGLSPTARDTQRTQDAVAQPYTGYGMIFVRDDVVKLAELLSKGEGKIGGTQVLDATMVASTLQLGSGGLSAGSSADRYHNGFWYYDINQSGYAFGCGAAKWVPYMSGYGGIGVVLFPNGMVYYNFSDGNEHAWLNTAKELDKVARMCP